MSHYGQHWLYHMRELEESQAEQDRMKKQNSSIFGSFFELQRQMFAQKNLAFPAYAALWGAFSGFAAVCMYRFTSRRYWLAGIYGHITWMGIGWVLGVYYDRLRWKHFSSQEAAYDHYMMTHMRDFEDLFTPPPKYQHVLYQWYPNRELTPVPGVLDHPYLRTDNWGKKEADELPAFFRNRYR